jgi:hypothetical protein
MNEIATPESPPQPTVPPVGGLEFERMLVELEQRVQMLEVSVSELQDTRQLEERITERVATRIPPPPPPEPPAPLPLLREPIVLDPLPDTVQSSWLVFDLYNDARAMAAMLFDGRYHMAWLARVTAIVLLVAIFSSGWWFPLSLVPFVGGYIDKLLDLGLALLLFLLLNRETRRYRDWRAGRR